MIRSTAKRTLFNFFVIMAIFLLAGALDNALCLFNTKNFSQNQNRTSGYISPETSVVDRQFNFHVIAPGVWRSAQPSADSLRVMKAHGLKTIINLRRSKETDLWEQKIARDLGMAYYHFPIDPGEEQPTERLARILVIMNDPSRQPVLLHCLGGKDRTGLVAALYKIQFLNMSKEDAYSEMLMYGYSEKDCPSLRQVLVSWDRTQVKKVFEGFKNIQMFL